MYDFKNRWGLVTGASSGIGEALARKLGSLGMNLVLVARREDRLNAVAEHLRSKDGVSVEVVAADLLAPGQPEEMLDRIPEPARDLDLLVNNAGFAIMGRCEETQIEEVQRMLDLNISVLTRLTYSCLPRMLARGQGAIVNIASQAAFQPVCYMPAYAASKAYVLSFSEALWAEVRRRGVHVMAVCPGFIQTEFLDVARIPEHLSQDALTPEDVVRATLHGLRRRKPCVTVGFKATVLSFMPRLAHRSLVAGMSEWIMRPPAARR